MAGVRCAVQLVKILNLYLTSMEYGIFIGLSSVA